MIKRRILVSIRIFHTLTLIGLTVLSTILLRRVISFGGLDLYVLAFLILGLIPSILLLIIAVVLSRFAKCDVNYKVSLILSVLFAIASLVMMLYSLLGALTFFSFFK